MVRCGPTLSRSAASVPTALSVICTLVAGCVVGPNYHLPKEATINAPAAQGSFVSAQDTPGVVAALPPPHWWHLYRSPELNRLVTDALAGNTDLRVAEANLERSRALVALALTERQPQVGFNGGVVRSQLSAQGYLFQGNVPVSTLYDVNLSASYEIDLFGRIKRGIEAARADDEAVQAARDWVRVSVAADVVGAYVDLCGAGDELAIAQNALDLQRENLELTRRLVGGGRGADQDLVRSQSLVDELRASIPTLESRRRNDLYALVTLAGKPPSEFGADLDRCVATPTMDQPIPIGDGAALLKRRPDVRAAERELAAATAEIGVATAELYPRVVLGISVGSTGLASSFLTKPTNEYSVGPGIHWELNHSAARAKIAGAKATAKSQLARFDGVVLTALREVESALNTYSHDLEREKDLISARDDAARNLADARRREVAGRGEAFETLAAEQTLTSVETALAALDTQTARDQVGLFLALGGGWEIEQHAGQS
jgi:outer membrane protein, multidrug efflux system